MEETSNWKYMTGDYVDDFRDACVAGFLAGEPVLIVGGAGIGKTVAMKDILNRITEGRYVFIRFEASSQAEVVKGYPDPVAWTRGEYKRILKGTPYDPDIRAVGFDELGRPPDVVFDRILDCTDRMDIPKDSAPVVLATTNFMSKSERNAAMRDRFAFWVRVRPESLQVREMIEEMMKDVGGDPHVKGSLPSWQDIQDTRAALPGPKAIKAIADFVETLVSEATVQGFKINPRHLNQWQKILFRCGFYYSGKNDNFETLPAQAAKVIQWCFVLENDADADKWASVCSACVDIVGAKIEAMLQSAYEKFSKIMNEPVEKRSTMSIALGNALSEAQAELAQYGGEDDTRIDKAMKSLTNAFSNAVKGLNPMTGQPMNAKEK